METEYFAIPEPPEEELFPEDELLAVERMNEVSPLTVQNVLMDAVDGLESYDAAAYNSIYNNEYNIDTEMFDDDPYGMQWQNYQIITNYSSDWPEILENRDFSIVDTDLPDVNRHTINEFSELKLKKEEQNTVDIKEEATSKIIDNNKMIMDIKPKSEEQRTDENELKCLSCSTLPALSQETNKRNANSRKRNQNTKGKRKKDSIAISNEKVKLEEQEDCVDVETIPRDEVPVLEAVDVKSLLEQFEASENPNPRNKSTIKNNHTYDTRSNKPCQMKQECRIRVSEKSISQASTQQKDIRTSLSKDIIDKMKASGRKRTIPIIPAMPNMQSGIRSNNVRTQGRILRNKVSKTSFTVTNNAKSRTFNSALVQLDHDYCSSSNTKSYKTTKHISIFKSSQNKNIFEECLQDLSISRDRLTSVNICNINQKFYEPVALQEKVKDNLFENNHKDNQKKEVSLKQSHDSNNSLSIENINSNESPKFCSKIQLNIRSALAKRILQSRGILPKTSIAQTSPKPQHMVSILKTPPNAQFQQISTDNSNENIVTTTNSLNKEVQNIIVQNTQNTLSHEVKTNPPRKKLDLTEYLKRKNKNKIIPKKKSPTVLTYVYHAATKTEFIIKDELDKPEIWCEREIISVLKDKSEIKKEKYKPKPCTCDAEVQTYESMFDCSTNTVMERDEKREENTKSEDQKSCKRYSRSLSRSRSRSKSRNKTSRSNSRSRSIKRSRDRRRSRSHSKSRSRSRSQSRTRSKNRTRNRNIDTRNRSTTRSRSRNRSRSRSRRCSNTRQRTISHRRSSISSSSSWSSRSISTKSSFTFDSRSRSRSRNRYRSRNRSRSRSRSRSRFRSRSRSRSSKDHYSSCSRSSSSSNFGTNRWSSYRRRNSSDRERNYDKYERHSFTNHHSYRSCRSPLHSYHKSYDNWYNREKQREVEERRVIYVGRLNKGITKADLHKRFEIFGPIVDVTVHFRERGDNYGFVTFMYNTDAYSAVEHGNDNPSLPRYDLCFGGRRAFCKSNYADLDDMKNNAPISRLPQANEENTFDYLLKEAKAQLRKRRV